MDREPLETEIEQGVSWQLAQHRRQSLGNVKYLFALSIPENQEQEITGSATITFELNDKSGSPVVIDFLSPDQRVTDISVNGNTPNWRASHDHIVISKSAFRAGTNTVQLYFIAGDEAFNRSADFMYALFVPDRAHYSLPLFDQPNLKARVTWQITAPKDWQVIANGPATTEVTTGEQTQHFFAETRPMSSYLFAVAAGKFKKETATLNGRELTMFHRETDAEKVARNKDEIFKLHGETLAWLEDYTEIDYPFQKFDFVLIPSFQYGGMEHPGGILYRQASLLLDETATQQQILGRASLIAHETAHMWFGDLVTMDWFDDVWTKEVFANFMAAKIVNPAFPDINHELRFLTAHHPRAYSVDRTDGANPIRQPLENLRFAGTLYGAIIYQKAPIVMSHLENRVGKDQFRDGMREYLAKYAYANATWLDLISILDKRTDEDLAAWSKVWVGEAGRPTINVIRDAENVTISQQDPQGAGRIWPQTLKITAGSDNELRSFEVELGQQAKTLSGLGSADFILPNGSGLEYGNFVLDDDSRNYLIDNVSDLESALLRGSVWVTLWDELLYGRLDRAAFKESLMNALALEQDELIIARLLGYLNTLYWNFSSAEERGESAVELEALLWSQVVSERSRSARASFYASYRGLALSDEGVSRLYRLWQEPGTIEDLPLSETEQIALAAELVLRGFSNHQQLLEEQRSRIKNPDRLARFDFVRPALSVDSAERKRFFESLADVENRSREAWVLTGLGYLHHPLRATDSLQFIRPALDLLNDIQTTGDIFFPGRWLDVNVGRHNSAQAAEIVTQFLAESNDLSARLRLKVLQSADGLFRSARLVHGWAP